MFDSHDKYAHTPTIHILKIVTFSLSSCIPDRPFLGCPALADLEKLFDTELVCGNMHRFRHYSVKDMNLITTSLTRFLEVRVVVV